jgi:hypothetical protein
VNSRPKSEIKETQDQIKFKDAEKVDSLNAESEKKSKEGDQKDQKLKDNLTQQSSKINSQQNKNQISSQHPHRYIFSLFDFQPLRPLDLFNTSYSQGFFDDEDLEFFDFRDRDVSHFGRSSDDFFGSNEISRQLGQGKDSFSVSKNVYKRTTFDNGKRKSITYTKKVDADGKVDEQAKEEMEDENGEKRVKYIDDIEEYFKKESSTQEQLEGAQKSDSKIQENKDKVNDNAQSEDKSKIHSEKGTDKTKNSDQIFSNQSESQKTKTGPSSNP